MTPKGITIEFFVTTHYAFERVMKHHYNKEGGKARSTKRREAENKTEKKKKKHYKKAKDNQNKRKKNEVSVEEEEDVEDEVYEVIVLAAVKYFLHSAELLAMADRQLAAMRASMYNTSYDAGDEDEDEEVEDGYSVVKQLTAMKKRISAAQEDSDTDFDSQVVPGPTLINSQ